MSGFLSKRVGIDWHSIVEEDNIIVLYQKGGNGNIVAIYDSVAEICKSHRFLQKPERIKDIVQKCIYGKSKYFTSRLHKCKCVPRIEKREKYETRNRNNH